MKPEHFDMLLAFVLREKRYLKKRETSFTEKELKDGEDLFKSVIKAVQSKKLPEDELKEVQANPVKRSRFVSAILAKCGGLARKQVMAVVEHYDMVYSVIEKKHKEHKIVLESLRGDRFYNPKKRLYH
ncbi:MAG: hypothetical protein V1708_05305 [Candidatus Micrarchaeota archaeon]